MVIEVHDILKCDINLFSKVCSFFHDRSFFFFLFFFSSNMLILFFNAF
jgi:hypothetical protein